MRPVTSSLHVGVIGAGAWGTALARLAALNGHRVSLWARNSDQVAAMTASRENRRRLPAAILPEGLTPVSGPRQLQGVDIALLAIPSRAFVAVLEAFAPLLEDSGPIVIATKGLHPQTGQVLSEIVSGVLSETQVLTLSGPSFAEDVAAGLPTAVTLAGPDEAIAIRVRGVFSRKSFRIYASGDRLGTELGGAAKNVLAIAAGIVQGKALGDSARAALIARSFAELGRLVEARGGLRETVAGLSGLGDLVLTCSSKLSRNFSFGCSLGQGQTVAAALAASRGVVEGAATAPVLAREAVRLGLDLPITMAVADIVSGQTTVDAAIESILARPPGPEL